MESREITVEDVIRAGRTLFGPGFAVGSGAWRGALKETYRRRALETHPDRARSLGRAEADLAREFRAVAEAYRILSALGARPVPVARVRPAPAPARPGAPRRPPGPRRPAASAAPEREAPGAPRVRPSVRPEDLPRRRLRMAEYLYYSGRLRWSELVDAIAWQRTQRPPFGRIAVELGFLAHDDVGVILERRRLAGAHGIPFGEWAVRLGRLTPFQVLAVLGRQLRLQRPIGRFFVERGLLEADELDDVRQRVLRHNVRYAG